ncbi:sigma-54 dependent transcriptional regulator [Cocleimonas flava]|uniref:Two-component system response regulator HupR/HoxA n=1 Tax=Cocleimonas flava TaxID=634765 RepID=A0A4V2P961_9GAMM|nr:MULTISPECIES: sigma-54 dependent transcriptional regulator [Cocleimonas]MEB8430694.1 sigma-54 dependent transcriptional regulator [Cocleimonas sp. KMM 6892]MEC4714534.1 sigma-54 dependent transcriptional regulator [Cocleimonas sp. KMM 6895]MEC4743867.1 sigma-54 dependent transcriptional regulator [Cocleimonas sp. KMM 6896]TCJ88395.1 two-component system response regulator HupR/HoxA [Cocleimonas flava]
MSDTSANLLPSILIVDDEARSIETLERILDEYFDVHTASNAKEALDILEQEWIQVVLCDQRMPDVTGVELCGQIRETWPEVIRMIISGYTDSEDIINAINEGGIYQYISKPWHPEDVILKLKNAVELSELHRKNERLAIELKLHPKTLKEAIEVQRKALQSHYSWEGIVRSPDSIMNATCDTVKQVSPFDVSVLITGESGTGKELCSRALHYNSLRQNEPFVAENCGALPDELLESELFGHKKGAFTGAVEDRIGLFESANGGTIFLDEIGDISPAFQLKLLRVLQEKEVRPLGSNKRRPVDVRIVAATNKNLEDEVREGRFRQDLYYRLATFTIQLPPLRDRLEDIPYLTTFLLDEIMNELGKRVDGITTETMDCFQKYQWPGNVRELQNELKRMLVLTQTNKLEANTISPHILRATPDHMRKDMSLVTGNTNGTLKDRIEQLESRVLKETLVRHSWNKTRAAEELGLSRVGLRSKLERYGLEQADQDVVQLPSKKKISNSS